MRGAPQVGFSLAIWKINCWSSLEIGVLPICLAFDLSRQYRRNARRCHSTTVSGFTTRSEAFHPGHTCLTATQNHLSIPANLGRRFFRFRTETCCRRTRFSSTKLPRWRKRRNMTPKASRKKRNMGEVIADGWVEETVEAVDFAAPHDFGERQPGYGGVSPLNIATRFRPIVHPICMRIRCTIVKYVSGGALSSESFQS